MYSSKTRYSRCCIRWSCPRSRAHSNRLKGSPLFGDDCKILHRYSSLSRVAPTLSALLWNAANTLLSNFSYSPPEEGQWK